MDRSKIEGYAEGGAELVKAFSGLSIDRLRAKQPDGSWTLHQIAIHMLDSDLIGSDRRISFHRCSHLISLGPMVKLMVPEKHLFSQSIILSIL